MSRPVSRRGRRRHAVVGGITAATLPHPLGRATFGGMSPAPSRLVPRPGRRPSRPWSRSSPVSGSSSAPRSLLGAGTCPRVRIVPAGVRPAAGPDYGRCSGRRGTPLHPGHRSGCPFAVAPTVRLILRSLTNIHQGLIADVGVPMPTNGDPTRGADQGVLLLNRVSRRPRRPASHRSKGWEEVTVHDRGAGGLRWPARRDPLGPGRAGWRPCSARSARVERASLAAVGELGLLRLASVQPRQRPARRAGPPLPTGAWGTAPFGSGPGMSRSATRSPRASLTRTPTLRRLRRLGRPAEHLDAVAASAGKPVRLRHLLAIRGRLLADVVGPRLDAAWPEGAGPGLIVGGKRHSPSRR